MPRIASAGLIVALAAAYLLWRYVWFFRNPPRVAPAGEGVVSAADGTVVYVKKVEPGEPVVSIKQGLSAKLADIVHEDKPIAKLIVGVFMSPFDVHYNRAQSPARSSSSAIIPGAGRTCTWARCTGASCANASPTARAVFTSFRMSER